MFSSLFFLSSDEDFSLKANENVTFVVRMFDQTKNICTDAAILKGMFNVSLKDYFQKALLI